MKIRLLATVSLFFATAIAAFGQATLSLQECIDLAHKHNPEIRAANLQAQISRMDYNTARFSMLPTVSIGANHGYNFGRSIDRFTNQFVTSRILTDYFSFNSNWTLYNGLQTRNTIRQQQFNYMAGIKDLEAFKNQIAMNVASSYLSLLMAKELVKSLQSQVQTTEIQLERAKKLTLSGATDKGTELGLESQLASENLSLVEAQNQHDIARITLQNLILIPPSEDWDIAQPQVATNTEQPVFITEEIYNNALKKMPEIESSRFRLQSSEMMEKVNKGMQAPSLSLYANMNTVFSQNALQITNVVPTGTQPIGYVPSTNEPVLQPTFRTETRVIPFGEQMRNNFGQTLGVSLSWNLFNGFYVRNNIQKSRFNVEVQQSNLQQAQNTLKANITRAIADYNAAKARIAAAEKALDAARLQMDFAEKRFENGLVNFFDYSNTKNQLTRAEIAMVQARYELLFNRIIVEFYNGNPIQIQGN